VAIATTLIYFIVVYVYPKVVKLLPSSRFAPAELRLVYLDTKGILREALSECARRGFSISDLTIRHEHDGPIGHEHGRPDRPRARTARSATSTTAAITVAAGAS
jgi:hypothetical protein